MLDHNHEVLKDSGIDIDSALSLLKNGRKFYANKIIDEYTQLYKHTEDLTAEASAKKGKESAIKALSQAYHKWFGLPLDSARELFEKITDIELDDMSDVEELDEDPINT